MPIKGMHPDRNNPTDSDAWKNDKQNQQRGSHEKGEEGAAAALGATDTQVGRTGEPGQSQGMDTRTKTPGKGN